MDAKHLLIVGVLASLVITFSGCTLPWQSEEKEAPVVTQVPNEGIIIEYFGPSESYIIGGQDVKIRVRVRNVGGAVGSVKEIKWPQSIYEIFEGTISLPTLPSECKNLNPPNPDKKQEGGYCEVEVKGTTKTVTSTKTYSGEGFKIRVKYNYTTEAKVSIPVYSTSIVNKKRRDGTLPSSKPMTENTYAPIKLEYGNAPYFEATGSSKTYEAYIFVRNEGSGDLAVDKFGRQKVNKITVTTPVTWASIDDSECRGGVTLQEGRCTIKITLKNNAPEDGVLPLSIKAEYEYVTQKSSSITIRP